MCSDHRSILLPSHELSHGLGPGQLRARLERRGPHALGQRAIVGQPAHRARQRLRRRLADEAVTPSVTSSAGPPESRHVITALRDANASTVTKP